jgi:hypothetical protein
MNEILFRVWDKELKCHHYENTSPDVIQGLIFQNPRYIVEQYIGVDNSKDRRIYEGDIVANETDKTHIGLIQFSKGAFGINFDYIRNIDPDWKKGRLYGSWGQLNNLRRLTDDFIKEEKFIIVGHIHENENSKQYAIDSLAGRILKSKEN